MQRVTVETQSSGLRARVRLRFTVTARGVTLQTRAAQMSKVRTRPYVNIYCISNKPRPRCLYF